MEAFELDELIKHQQASRQPYLEFLRVADLSAGLYVLPAGMEDRQQPHSEDEVYYVVSGRAVIRVVDEDRPVEAGSIIYVRAGAVHHFHSITERLRLLVFFAPAEGSQTLDA